MKTALYRHLRNVGPGLRAFLPQLFTHRFDLCTNLAPDECIEALKGQTSPMSDLGKTWGFKPVFASFDLSKIVLMRHSYAGMEHNPIVFARIDKTPSGSLIRCWATCTAGERVSTFIILTGFLFPVLILPSLAFSSEDRLSNLVAGLTMTIALPAAAWWVLKLLRNTHKEVLKSYSDFLTEILSARLAVNVVDTKASDSPMPSIIVSIVFVLLKFVLMATVILTSTYGILSLVYMAPSPSKLFMIGLLLFIACFGGAIFLLFRDPAFRRNPGAAKDRSPEGET